MSDFKEILELIPEITPTKACIQSPYFHIKHNLGWHIHLYNTTLKNSFNKHLLSTDHITHVMDSRYTGMYQTDIFPYILVANRLKETNIYNCKLCSIKYTDQYTCPWASPALGCSGKTSYKMVIKPEREALQKPKGRRRKTIPFRRNYGNGRTGWK